MRIDGGAGPAARDLRRRDDPPRKRKQAGLRAHVPGKGLGKEVRGMADELRENLTDYVEDAHAMEQSVLRSLDSMIRTTEDPEI